jgi:hypothetical protein
MRSSNSREIDSLSDYEGKHFNTNNGADSYGLAYYVPEPSSFMLIGIGAFGFIRRKRR